MDVPAKRQIVTDRSEAMVERAYSFASLSNYTTRERLLIKLADLTMYSLIWSICRTVRWEVSGRENLDQIAQDGHLPILALWHDRIFLGTYFFRNRDFVVMTSQSFDGEYIARFIQRFGFGAVRGSSTRGAVGAMVEMARLMRLNCPAAFTIDGPKGPRYVAKMGALYLAKKTGNAILPFTITPKKYWRVNSWDKLQIPRPFTTALVELHSPIYVNEDADEQLLQTKRDELQQVLDSACVRGEEWRRQ